MLYRVDNKPREFVKIAAGCFPRDLVLSVSPDSGTEMSVTAVAAERDQLEMEPVEVSAAREAVAMLGVVKRRLEAQHERMGRRLKENRAAMAEIREVCALSFSLSFSSLFPLLPSFPSSLSTIFPYSLRGGGGINFYVQYPL